MSYRLRPQAEADIEAIAVHIAEDNPSAAKRWCVHIIVFANGLGKCRTLELLDQMYGLS